MKTGNTDAYFVLSGYTNWNNATCAFKKHEVSDAHKATIKAIVTIPKTTRTYVGTALSERYKQEFKINREMLLKLISIIRYRLYYLLYASYALEINGDTALIFRW